MNLDCGRRPRWLCRATAETAAFLLQCYCSSADVLLRPTPSGATDASAAAELICSGSGPSPHSHMWQILLQFIAFWYRNIMHGTTLGVQGIVALSVPCFWNMQAFGDSRRMRETLQLHKTNSAEDKISAVHNLHRIQYITVEDASCMNDIPERRYVDFSDF